MTGRRQALGDEINPLLCPACGEGEPPPGRLCGACRVWLITRHRSTRSVRAQLSADLRRVGVDPAQHPDLGLPELLELLEGALCQRLAASA